MVIRRIGEEGGNNNNNNVYDNDDDKQRMFNVQSPPPSTQRSLYISDFMRERSLNGDKQQQ